MQNDEDKIRQRAYEIWDREGRQDGRDQDYWLQAERELGVSEAGELGVSEASVPAGPIKEPGLPVEAKKKGNGAVAPAVKSAPGRKRRGAQPAPQA
jgi:hypothetical protein